MTRAGADRSGISNGDANDADANGAGADVAIDKSPMVDLLVLLLKLESNSRLIQNEANFFLSSH